MRLDSSREVIKTRLRGSATSAGSGAAVLMWLLTAPAAAVVNSGIDEDAQLPYWEIVDPGVTIRLVQRLPEQTRGFFEARGFSESDAERIAQSCVFQTVFKNISHQSDPSPIEYNLHDWVVHADGRQRTMKTREDWRRDWTARQAPKAAQLAFEWALFPTRQRYRPGDYNWGMSVFDLKPGTLFDLDVVWHQFGRDHTVRIKGMRCAPDIHLEPGAL